jgi:hypothetical protein
MPRCACCALSNSFYRNAKREPLGSLLGDWTELEVLGDLRPGNVRGAEVLVSLNVVVVLVLAPEVGGRDVGGGDIPMRLDIVTLVLAPEVGGRDVGAVVLMTLDVLLLVDRGLFWPLVHLNCLLFEFLNLHTRRCLRPKSSSRRFKNAIPADILRA